MVKEVEKTVCLLYGITVEDMRNGGSKKIPSSARAMTWYILHCVFSISSNSIAREYCRTPRGVKMTIAKFKFQLSYDKQLNDIYSRALKTLN